jgi:hypothetical protein
MINDNAAFSLLFGFFFFFFNQKNIFVHSHKKLDLYGLLDFIRLYFFWLVIWLYVYLDFFVENLFLCHMYLVAGITYM